MQEIDEEELKEIVSKYKEKLKGSMQFSKELPVKFKFSKEYQIFKKEVMPAHFSFYENACNYFEKIIKFRLDKKKKEALQESINICHLNITPEGSFSFSIIIPLVIIFFGSMFSYLISGSFFFVFIFFIMGVILIGPLGNIPHFFANSWRLKASNQMVLCIFYVVTYMRHTSNIENAIEFASEHLSAPLSLDLRKVLWDVETQKYDSVKESLDNYLETWRRWNLEFIEAFHLIESSLYEGEESRRLTTLDKSLDVILSETYEKMLHYAQNLKGPIEMLHMLGVIIPILGLVVLPLLVSFMENVKWYHISTLYNFILPIGIYYLGKSILSNRPTGYGDTDISEDNPELKKYKNVIINIRGFEINFSPLYISIIIGVVFFIIGISPLLMHALDPTFDIPLGKIFSFLEYRQSKTNPEAQTGPYGLGAAILSLFIPLGLGLSIGMYYKLKSKNVIKIRNNVKKLESEFASALFQLGNRLGDGLPAEIAFSKVSAIMKDTISGQFFDLVSSNISRLGMSVKDAIFDPKSGALIYFPSNLIESSMKVLVQSVKKGSKISAQALTNISRYIKEIHTVNERLRDLMSDIISSMKSQINFLSPAISGIVVGITAMITTILGKLSIVLPKVAESSGGEGMGGAGNFLQLFGDGIPTYYFQIVVGIYVVELVYILTVLSNGIENGSDKLGERYALGQNLVRSTLLYAILAGIVTLLFNIIAGTIMSNTLSV